MMDTTERDIRLLNQLARKLRSNPNFMSHVLYAYRQQEQLSEEDLSNHLGTSPEMLVRLALCKRPASGSPTFASEITDLSDYTLIEETAIAHLIRQVDGLGELARLITGTEAQTVSDAIPGPLSGLLAAARDRDDEYTEQEHGDELDETGGD